MVEAEQLRWRSQQVRAERLAVVTQSLSQSLRVIPRLQHVIPKAIAAAEHERANTLLPTFPIPPQQHHKTHNIVELQSQALSLLHALATTAVGPLSL